MHPRTVILLVVALALAGGTAFMVNGWLSAQKSVAAPALPPPPPPPQKEVLVAKQELPTGTFLRPEHMRWQIWPEDGVIKGTVVKGQGSEKDFEGAVVRSRLYAGEPLTAERVVHRGEQGFLAAVLDPGKRAISVPVDATRGVAGFVFPGDLVDVLLSYKSTVQVDGDQAGRAETRFFSQTFLSGVRVIGIDQTVDNQGAAAKVAKTATLEVTPKQAEKIAVALELGELSLTLHSIAQAEVDVSKLANEMKTAPKVQPSVEHRNYTRDMDVLEMMGDPYGVPYPDGVGPKVNIVRGSKDQVVRF